MAKLVVAELELYSWNMVYATASYIDGTDLFQAIIPVFVDATAAQSLRNQTEGGLRQAFNDVYSGLVPAIGQNDIEYLC